MTMGKKVIFTVGNEKLTMPVEPSAYTAGWEQSIENVTLYSTGTAALAGKPKAAQSRIELLLPHSGHSYTFAGKSQKPEYYINKLKEWMRNVKTVKYEIEKTPVKRNVHISSMEISQKDATGDIFLSMTLIDDIMPKLQTIRETPPKSPKSTIKKKCGKTDTLKTLDRDNYGTVSMTTKTGKKDLDKMLAKYNNKSEKTILKGKIIKIPPWAELKKVKGWKSTSKSNAKTL